MQYLGFTKYDKSDSRFRAGLGGFFDGEGCVRARSDGPHIEVALTQRTRPILDAIQARLGYGSVSHLTSAGGNFYLFRTGKQEHVLDFLTIVSDYVYTKSEEVEIALLTVRLAMKADSRNISPRTWALRCAGASLLRDLKHAHTQGGATSPVTPDEFRKVMSSGTVSQGLREVTWQVDSGVSGDLLQVRSHSRRRGRGTETHGDRRGKRQVDRRGLADDVEPLDLPGLLSERKIE